ncbi:MAG: GGDEF domain-containing protein [Pseudohongiella sp.]|nr:GGDEF domain-containing protein [Pseudohongiella sp.]
MFSLDLLTLVFSIALASTVSSLVMIVLWRVNRTMPGIWLWTLSVLISALAFFCSVLGNVAPDSAAFVTVVSNTLSTSSVMIALEGCLRFRGFDSDRRWKLMFILVPVFILISALNLDDLRTRLMLIDLFSIAGFLAMAIIMVWKTESATERNVYALSSFFAVLPAVALIIRWFSVYAQDSASNLAELANGNLIFVAGLAYIMGWTFSLTVACYYKSQKTIFLMSREDSLTALPNRRSIDEVLGRTILEAERYGRPFGVVIMDLNDFKRVNDTLGHMIGDAVLVQVAERLRSFARGADFVGRLGGDEFLLIVHDINSPEIASRAVDRLLKSISGHASIENHSIPVTPSAGIAVWPEDGRNSHDLKKVADRRMYLNKQAQSLKAPVLQP